MTDQSPPAQIVQGALPLELAARRIGGYVWLNRRLFEVLGGWVATSQHAETQLLLGQHCYQHAWHAELFQARLPQLRELSADQFTVAPNQSALQLLDALQAQTGIEERLAGAYRVVMPRLATAYEAHLRLTVPITDAPVIRSLKLALTDVAEQWRAGEAVLQQLLLTSETIERSARVVGELELLALGAFEFRQ